MIGRIDELVARLFSFFVLPVLNVAIVSLLLHWCLADQYSASSLLAAIDIGGLTQYFVNVLGAVVSGNFDTIKDLAGRYSSQIATVSNIVVLVLFLTIVIAMYLLDRAIYYVNWFVPLDYDFDLATYGARHRGDPRVRRLFALLGQPFDFASAIGAVRSFLGEHSVDAYRVARRNTLVRSQAAARVGFDYAKSYVCLLFIAWLFAIFAPALKFSAIALCLAASALIALAYLIWYSHAYREMLEFDIDSFVALRAYDQKDDRFVKAPEDAEDLGATLVPAVSSGFLDLLYLKHLPAGVFFEVYCLGRSLVCRLAGRRAPDV